ncbi:MAG: hypothetical protein J7L32_02135 [Thermoplasmata archaeon]|nr:hypothetical protein [Thermoplasmata archaeon]RLF25368.1 MAG: hypothetical protein DRN01_06475 [Thermoplasmata archaeon]
MEETTVKTDNLRKLLLDESVGDTPEDELAFFMNRFNLDIETVEAMPAFEEHIKPIFSAKEED